MYVYIYMCVCVCVCVCVCNKVLGSIILNMADVANCSIVTS